MVIMKLMTKQIKTVVENFPLCFIENVLFIKSTNYHSFIKRIYWVVRKKGYPKFKVIF